MADEDVATRAPESDAQADKSAEQISGIPGDTKPDQSAATMGEHCATDRPTPPGEQPTGELTTLDDIDVYITKPADYPHSSSRLLLLLTGGTGIRSINNQLQADKYAAEGYVVVMPDQFASDPAPNSNTAADPSATSTEGQDQPSLIDQVKLGVASVAKSFTIDMWLARHTPAKVLPLLHRVLGRMREDFADALAAGGGVYAVGYCFGARYVLLLGGETGDDVVAGQKDVEGEAEEGMVKRGPWIKAGAIAHGVQIGVEEMGGVKVPMSVVAVEGDGLFPDREREEGRKLMEERGVVHEVQVYPGVPHGFAVLGDYADESIREKQGRAWQQMLAWLKAH